MCVCVCVSVCARACACALHVRVRVCVCVCMILRKVCNAILALTLLQPCPSLYIYTTVRASK